MSLKNKSTQEGREHWQFAEKTADEVREEIAAEQCRAAERALADPERVAAVRRAEAAEQERDEALGANILNRNALRIQKERAERYGAALEAIVGHVFFRTDAERAFVSVWEIARDALSTPPTAAEVEAQPGSEVLCPRCAHVFCPSDDPLHFHHDGCPSCSEPRSIGEEMGLSGNLMVIPKGRES